MKVRDILAHKGGQVVVIDPQATVHVAVRKLNEHRIGALVVTGRDGAIVGILSERDILHECGARCDAVAEGRPSLEAVGPALVRDLMTREVVTGDMDDDLTAVMSVMTEHRIRHLPIVEEGGLVGIISIGDAVKACVQMAEEENQHLKAYIQGTSY